MARPLAVGARVRLARLGRVSIGAAPYVVGELGAGVRERLGLRRRPTASTIAKPVARTHDHVLEPAGSGRSPTRGAAAPRR